MRTTVLLFPFLALLACFDSQGTSLSEIRAQQARWRSHLIRDYQYLYKQTGFNSQLTGRTIKVVVLGDTVRMANDTLTGDSIPTVWGVPPTVDGLFDMALAGFSNGSLTAISFDPALGYPLRLDLAGPPDASGSIFASNLQPLLTAAPPRQ
jgi:hypothetical protein